MKHYLEQNGIKTVDAEVIQYGEKEFAIKKLDAKGDIMPVLVDFAMGKPMFVIHTDHHDRQAGVEKETSTSFRPSRSNVETISQIVSPKDIFSPEDIDLISTVDSANFAVKKISPEQVMNYLFKFDKEKDLKQNKMLMGLVVNKLLLAFKNKPGFLEQLVLECQPSLISILNKIRQIVQEKGYAKPEELTINQQEYLKKQKESEKVKKVGNVIVQYGGGSMIKPGSYDRYTPFRNNPDADFIVIAWPMGLVQASCNPFKEDRSLKGVDLGEMKNEVLEKFEDLLKGMEITFGRIKSRSESSAEFGSVGFTFKDMVARYGKYPSFKIDGGDKLIQIIDDISEKLYKTLTNKQKELLDRVKINGWDIIKANSGGHKCITNLSGMMYLFGKEKETSNGYPDDIKPIISYSGNNSFVNDLKNKFKRFGTLSPKQIEVATSIINKESGVEKTIENNQTFSSYVEFTKAVQDEFVRVLNKKITGQPNLQESTSLKKLIRKIMLEEVGMK
jgi:hypothetical protein